MGLLERFKSTLTRTRVTLADGIAGLFQAGRPIDESLLSELEALLYSADLGPLAPELCEELRRRHRRGEIAGEGDVRAGLRSALLARVRTPPPEPTFEKRPTVVLVGACDTYRAAAADQLAIWADRSNVQIVRKEEGADPAAVAFEALEAAAVLGYDLVLLDTAGRLHTQKQLMEELKKIQRVAGRRVDGAPHEVWLVLDATNGQNAIQQARLFTATVQVTGVIVAKLDGTARAGALFRIQQELGLPVRYVGTGEGKEDFEVFEPEAFVDAILAG